VALPQILSDAPLESEGPKFAWYGFLAAHLNYFASLVCRLVADSMLVEYVMIRAVAPTDEVRILCMEGLCPRQRPRSVLFRSQVGKGGYGVISISG
jgi:hypothetical protein